MAQNLFALSAQTAASDSNKPLVSFRAGKCTFANNTVTPINKKGTVQLIQTPDFLLHFQWKDRTSGAVEDDLIIFPEEAVFSKVTQGTPGRVFILKFKTSERKLFFWMQEPKDDKDKEIEEKVNQYINSPPTPDQPSGELRRVTPAQVAPVSRPATSAQPSQPQSPSQPQVQPDSQPQAQPQAQSQPQQRPQPVQQNAPQTQPALNLANIDLSSLLAQYAGQSSGTQQQNVDLVDLMSPDNLLPILSQDPAIVQELSTYLPEEERRNGLSALRELLFSPQFQQGVEMFEHIVTSGQGNEVLRQFGVDPLKAGPLGVLDLNGFFQALQQSINTPK